ncbi:MULTISPECIES: hypothetical protein [Paenibacillus]|uniref:Acetyltransferase n=1 Tax=Paenibacillus violae TaxID=3077234 RepID=A0ABU3R9I9_9BACL|nr:MULTISPECIES: hypothetical protein [Paenibacillus]MDU0200918.1 hypothetical protein [Paenibacillus sp. PFR10]MEC0264776.1 hypothetical protein [Paenibacillus anseongense]
MPNNEVKTLSESRIFTIDCKDVYLKEYTFDDLDQFHSLIWQPEIYEYLPGWSVSKERRKIWLTDYEIIQKCGFNFQSVIEIDNESYNYYKLDKNEWKAKV